MNADQIKKIESLVQKIHALRKELSTINADQTKKIDAIVQKIDVLCNELYTQINTYGFLEEFKKKQKKKLPEIQKLVLSIRPPRLLIIGRRGSGKSSLINAMIGEYKCETSDVATGTSNPEWFRYTSEKRDIRVLDTQGFKDPSKGEGDSESQILKEIKKECPDVVLFLCKAKEVNAAIDGDLDSAEKILKEIQSFHNRCISLIGVVTQCDELTPPNVKISTEHIQKIKNIEKATSYLKNHLLSLDKANTALQDSFERGSKQVVPTVAYARYNERDRKIIKDDDYPWKIEELMKIIDKRVPDEASDERRPKILKEIIDELAHLQADLQDELVRLRLEEANKVLDFYAPGTGLVAGTVSCVSPIPGVTLTSVLAIQLKMVIEIAKIGGHEEITLKDALDFLLIQKGLSTIVNDVSSDIPESILSIVAEGVSNLDVLQEMDKTLLKWLPFIGDAIKGFMSANATKKLGEAAISYYILNEDIPPETPLSLVPAWAE